MLTPYMPQNEIAMMDAVFALKRPARVLEYGIGGSTVRWSKCPSIKRWVGVEHSDEWLSKVWTSTGDIEKLSFHRPDEDDARSYVAWRPGDPRAAWGFDGPFDLIFVDGLYRVECVKASPQWLAPGGVVILHDAIRTEYAKAWDVYPHRAMLTRGECIRRKLNIEHDGCRNGLMLMWGDE